MALFCALSIGNWLFQIPITDNLLVNIYSNSNNKISDSHSDTKGRALFIIKYCHFRDYIHELNWVQSHPSTVSTRNNTVPSVHGVLRLS